MPDNPYAPPAVAVLPPAKQSIWTKELKSARTILIFVGVIQLIFGAFELTRIRSEFDKGIEAEVKERGPGFVVDRVKADELFEENKALIYGLGSFPLVLGVFFLVMAAIVFRFPVGVTLSSLIVYVVALVATAVVDPSQIAMGIPLKIIVIAVLAKAWKSARNARSLLPA
jgi:hypothetical protein